MAYRRILNSTTLMVPSSGISALAGLAKNKFAAVFNWATCVGMTWILNQYYTMRQQIFGLGLSTSKLRYVSEGRTEATISLHS